MVYGRHPLPGYATATTMICPIKTKDTRNQAREGEIVGVKEEAAGRQSTHTFALLCLE